MARQKNVVTFTIDIANSKDVENAIASLSNLARDMERVDTETVKQFLTNLRLQVFAPMLRKLRVYPPKPTYPLRWKSEKQRRYVMMMLTKQAKDEGREKDANGNLDISYRRTGKLKNGWKYELTAVGNSGYTARVYNDAKSKDPISGKSVAYERFVMGDIGLGNSRRSNKRYGEPIQPFHKDTGWQPAAPIIQQAYFKAELISIESYENAVYKVLAKYNR